MLSNLGLPWIFLDFDMNLDFKHIQAIPSLFMMLLLVTWLWDLKYFGGKLPTGKKETGKFGQGIYTIVQNLHYAKLIY